MSRLVCVLFAVLRLFVIAVAVQSTGVLHVAADVLEEIADGTAHHADDCDDESGPGCPPGCPSCHCMHGMVALDPVPPAYPALVQPPAPEEQTVWWNETQTIPTGSRTSVFRPPRTTDFTV